jgi:hypothetical protein
MKELAEESERKKAAVLRFPNPLNAAKRLLRNFNRYVEEGNVRDLPPLTLLPLLLL